MKKDAKLDRWLKDVAPSSDLSHVSDVAPSGRYFVDRYRKQLADSEASNELRRSVEDHDLTLVYAAEDAKRGHA